jgi:hypothetical protein
VKIDGGQDGYWWECEDHGRSPYRCQFRSEIEYLAALHAAIDNGTFDTRSVTINRHPSEYFPEKESR